MHELTVVNAKLARYVLRFLDAEAGQAEPVTVADELTFADSVASAADAIRARAERRKRQGDGAATATEGV